MNPRYQDFADRNPTFQDRIEAFTSGILTPNTKAIALWAMEPERFYNEGELYRRIKEFAGGTFPITSPSIWQYCNGTPEHNWEGSLYAIGAVVRDHLTVMDTASGPLIEVTYAKTRAGED